MKMNETVAGLTITAKTEGVDQAKKQTDALVQSTQQLGVVAETSSKGARSLEDNWKRATLRFDEAARGQAIMARETKLAEAAVRSKIATDVQAEEHLKRVAQRYGEVGTAVSKMTAAMSTSTMATQRMVAGMSEMSRAADAAAKAAAARPSIVTGMSASGMTAPREFDSTASQRMLAGMSQGGEQAAKGIGLARHELINLSRQAQDVGVSLASGQSPLTVLMQQGSQIADVFISSGKSVGQFFTQAIEWATAFAKSPAGIITGVVAIGAAAIYAASQFLKSSTTIEEAIAKQKQLLKETKTAIDELIDAQIRLQSMDLKRFESVRNEEDLRKKLNRAMKETAEIGAGLGNIPGFGALSPGFEKINAAAERLNANIAAGQPGLAAYFNELGKIGQEHPALAKTIEMMIKAGQEGVNLEQSWLKARAALQSVAQVNLANLQTMQAAEGAERMAKATLELAAMYPGMSIEAAKQLDALNGQLLIAQARTGAEELTARQLITQNGIQLQNLSLEERIAIAAKQRAVAQEQINASAEQQLKNLQNEYELIKATSAEERSRIAARQEYDKLIKANVDPSTASAIASQMTANARATEEMARGTRQVANNIGDANDETKSWSVQMDEANDAINRLSRSTVLYEDRVEAVFRMWGNVAKGIENAMNMMGPSQFKAGGYEFSLDMAQAQAQKAGLERTYGAENVEAVTQGTGPEQFTRYQVKPSYLEEQAKMPGGGKYAELLKQQIEASKNLTRSTDNLAQTMTDVLSPFYQTDPRRTHLGFRSYAGGGIMTPYGDLPLKQYQGGGVATSPQVAVYGEGSTPEAYVPVPSGRIPVELKMPANSNRPVVVNIRVMGNADGNTVAALKSTAFQQAQSMRRAMR